MNITIELNIREQLIISQALVVASKELKNEEPYPQYSNIEDMEVLIRDKFPIWAAVEDANELIKNGTCNPES